MGPMGLGRIVSYSRRTRQRSLLDVFLPSVSVPYRDYD